MRKHQDKDKRQVIFIKLTSFAVSPLEATRYEIHCMDIENKTKKLLKVRGKQQETTLTISLLACRK